MDYIFIDREGKKDKIGIVEDSKLVEYYEESSLDKSIVGNIYRARVENVLPGMNAAFVNIGQEKNAYLQFKEILTKNQYRNKSEYNIKNIIKAGESILVQVIKEEVGDKGAKITKNITLPGRYMILTPMDEDVNISNKIRDREERKRLETIAKEIQKDKLGLILRTASIGISKKVLKKEYDYLASKYNRLLKEKDFLPVPKLIDAEMELGDRIIRDSYNPNKHKIIVNDEKVYLKIKEMETFFDSKFKEKLVFDSEFKVEYNTEIREGLAEGFSRKVNIGKYGYLVIDETEALTAIDINTGKFTGSLKLDETSFTTNLEATEEIARQIRLRDLSGIIIIDFISMKNPRYIGEVIDALKEEFKKDRNTPIIVGMTKLGLLEVTRKRIGNTLSDQISDVCPTCQGKGRIR